jgi:hypothetical protein
VPDKVRVYIAVVIDGLIGTLEAEYGSRLDGVKRQDLTDVIDRFNQIFFNLNSLPMA